MLGPAKNIDDGQRSSLGLLDDDNGQLDFDPVGSIFFVSFDDCESTTTRNKIKREKIIME